MLYWAEQGTGIVQVIKDRLIGAHLPRRLIPVIAIASTAVSATCALAAEDWTIAGQGDTCTYASDIAVRAGQPAFASPFLMERAGATAKVNRNPDGSIGTVDVTLGPDSHIIYFASMSDCTTTMALKHAQ